MTEPPYLIFLGVLVSVVGSIVVARITSAAAAKSSPYGELAKRVVTLEERVAKLEAERDTLRVEVAILKQERDALRGQLASERAENKNFIRSLISAYERGLRPPKPPVWYEPTD